MPPRLQRSETRSSSPENEKLRDTGQMRSLCLTEFGWTCFWFDGANDAPAVSVGDDLIFDLSLTDNPLAIKVFSGRPGTAREL